jgi:integrase
MPRKRGEGTRAPNMASSIYLGNDGRWHGRVSMGVRDDGRPDRRHVSAKTEAEVTRKVRALEKQRDSAVVRKTGRAWTVEKWLAHWLDNIVEPSVRRSTFDYYTSAVRQYLVPGLGAHRIDRLEPEHVEKLYARLRREGRKPATIQQVHRTLRAALNEAYRRDRIARNPVMLVKAPPQVDTEVEPFSVDEAKRILAAAQHRRNGVRFAVALALGLRRGEALGLRWSDLAVSWHHGCRDDAPCGQRQPADCPQTNRSATLTIRRALQRHIWRHGCTDDASCGRRRGADCPRRFGGGLVITDPKSRAGRRVMNVPGPLLAALDEHRQAQEREREVAADLWHGGDWMFTQPNGKPVDPRIDHDEWKTLLKEAGVRDARLHDARHTAATMLLVLKVPTRAVMDVMGWSQTSMTTRYQHVPNELRAGIATQLGALLWEPPHDAPEPAPGPPV